MSGSGARNQNGRVKAPKSPSPAAEPSSSNTFHQHPFVQRRPRAQRKTLEAQDELEKPVLLSPTAVTVASPPQRPDTAEDDRAHAPRVGSAQNIGWSKSEHEGLLFLHDGTKRWYHCELCDYMNDRLYHSKMHYQRIHINNGKSMPRKRKYVEGQDGPAPAVFPPRVEEFVTPALPNKKPNAAPPRPPAGSPRHGARTEGDVRHRLFPTPPGPSAKTSRVARNLKVVQTLDATHPEDAQKVLNNSVRYTFQGGSMVCQNGDGPGFSFKAEEMSSLSTSLPTGRSTISGTSSRMRQEKKIKQAPKGPRPQSGGRKQVEAAFSPQILHPHSVDKMEAGHLEPMFEHCDNSSSLAQVSSVRQQMHGSPVKPGRSPPISAPTTPSRQSKLSDLCHSSLAESDLHCTHTPLTDANSRLRTLRSATPESRGLQMLPPTSGAVEYSRSPGVRRAHADSSELLRCDETLSRYDMSAQQVSTDDVCGLAFESLLHQTQFQVLARAVHPCR